MSSFLIRAAVNNAQTRILQRCVMARIAATIPHRHLSSTSQRYQLDIQGMTLKDLREECRKRGLKVSGRKLDLQTRIQQHDVSNVSNDNIHGVQSQMNKITSQIQNADKEIASHSSESTPEHLAQDSEEVGSMVHELVQVQEQLDRLRAQARTMDRDVQSLINRDGGDITYTPLDSSTTSDVPAVDSLKVELDEARSHAAKLQEIVEAELKAATAASSTIVDAKTSTIETSTQSPPSPQQESKKQPQQQKQKQQQQKRPDGKKYILSSIGVALGLGWIFQDSIPKLTSAPETPADQITPADHKLTEAEVVEVVLEEPPE